METPLQQRKVCSDIGSELIAALLRTTWASWQVQAHDREERIDELVRPLANGRAIE